MVFKMVTLDLTQDIEDDFGCPPESPPSSPTSTTHCCSTTFAVASALSLDRARLHRRGRFHLPKTEQRIKHKKGKLLVESGNATIFNKFSEENMTGRVGSGKLYKSTTLPNGYVVAVKRISEKLVNISCYLT